MSIIGGLRRAVIVLDLPRHELSHAETYLRIPGASCSIGD
ncbi:hypothetical protein QFZ94_000190 [Paraburkholderia sp. JPY465]